MASAFEKDTLAAITVLYTVVERILTHLAKASPDPRSFLDSELKFGLESLAKTNYWSVSHNAQNEILEIAKTRYSEIIGNVRGIEGVRPRP